MKVMKREDILKNPEYWIAQIQTTLYNCAEKYMSENEMNRSQLAKHLGVSKGYVSQLLNGDYDHKLSKFVELALAFGVVPKIDFQPIEEAISEDRFQYKLSDWRPVEYSKNLNVGSARFTDNEIYEEIPIIINPVVA